MEPEITLLEKEKHLQITNFWVPSEASGVYLFLQQVDPVVLGLSLHVR